MTSAHRRCHVYDLFIACDVSRGFAVSLDYPNPPSTDQRSTGRELEPLADEARRIFRAEMVRRGVTFKALAELLNARRDGPPESVQTLINKVNRGRYSFAFLIRACRAMGIDSIGFGCRDVAGGDAEVAERAVPLGKDTSARSRDAA